MVSEEWIEENCECGLCKNGEWSEDLMEKVGCTCREENEKKGA